MSYKRAEVELKVTVYFESPFWVANFEKITENGYAATKVTLGGEPTEVEFYEYISSKFNSLRFGSSKKITVKEKKTNPKTALRKAKKEMEKMKQTQRPSTFAQDYMKEEMEKFKKEKKVISKEEKEAKKEKIFLMKQEKRKTKKKGR